MGDINGANILVVDDRPDKLLAFQSLLEDLGQNLILARSGTEALKQVLQKEFAVILLDVNMPDIDGLETARLIRQHKKAAHTPIIFLTAYADEMRTAQGYALGAVDYISTPIVSEVLRTKVKVFVDLYRMREALARSREILEQRVTERTAELTQTNERLQAEIAERRRVEAERESLLARERVLRAQAEEASRLKDQFLAMMSHELRTPLTAILGWAVLLRSGRLDRETAAHSVVAIEHNAKLQAQLIEDLLDVSRIMAGKFSLGFDQVVLPDIIKAAIDSVLPVADAKAIRIEEMFDPHIGPIRGDLNRLQQVVWNLLSNAVKFTPSVGQVRVRLERVGEPLEPYALITVSDTGKGIDADFLPYVFDPFRQADSTTTRKHGGLGLGLAIARHIVELHGGRISVESLGEGQGAVFSVRLPLRAVNPIGNAFLPAGQQASEEAFPMPDCPDEIRGLRVLVVDDAIEILEMLKAMLEQCGAEVRTCTSASAALEEFQWWTLTSW
jgi:signal transduction histidine kinase